jgi:hypothetical protein
MAGAISIGARVRPRKIPAHLGPLFVGSAVSLFGEMLAGKKLLAAKGAERNQHILDEGHIRDRSGSRRIDEPRGIFFFHFCVRVLQRKSPAAVARAAGARISGSIGWIIDWHGNSLKREGFFCLLFLLRAPSEIIFVVAREILHGSIGEDLDDAVGDGRNELPIVGNEKGGSGEHL